MSKFIARHFDSFNLGRVLVILLLSLVFACPGWAGAKKCDLTKAGPEIYEEILNHCPVWENYKDLEE